MQSSRLSLPPEEWPSVDRAAWETRFASIDVLDEINPAMVRRERGEFSFEDAYGRWLGFLMSRGGLASDVSPVDRVTPDAVRDYVSALKSRVRITTAYFNIYFLRRAISALAPERDWEWPRDIERGLYRVARRQRNERAVVPVEKLYALGFDLMARGERASHLRKIDRAVLFRDGLLIALLAARPIRRRNLANLRIGRHLIRAGDGWTISIPANETKNQNPVEAPLPSGLTHPVDRFLSEYRLVFKKADAHDYLWPSRNGGPLGPRATYQAIARRTLAVFGFRVGPNRFRACAATTIAIADPVNVAAATRLLGHTWLRTTERHYNLAQTIDASRRYQSHLDKLRARLGCGS